MIFFSAIRSRLSYLKKHLLFIKSKRIYNQFVKDYPYHILDIGQTVDYIIQHRCSISRFGDGEYRVMNKSGNGFQHYDEKLSDRLREVLCSYEDNIIIGLPCVFHSMQHLTFNAAYFWANYIDKHSAWITSITPLDKLYADASFTRFYMDYKDKSFARLSNIVKRIKQIWKGRDVYVIEGEGTRLGVGNGLLNNTKSLYRIICPSKDAFSKYDEILNVAQHYIPRSDNTLILCALGMTATVLSYDLTKLGYQCIDIGHVDIEYEWWKMKATKKMPVKDRNVNEIGSFVSAEISDVSYINSIIKRIV